jgi:beta-N-acetylhexosaminidase
MKPLSPRPAGEFLMLRLVAPQWSSSLQQQLRALDPGGVVLAPPLPRSPEAVCELLVGISRCLPSPPILVLDAQGDDDPLSGLLPVLPSPRALAQMGAQVVCRAGELIGAALKHLGFNAIFAPTLDLASKFTDDTLGMTAFSADPRVVAECAAAFVEGLSRHKIVACGKHFPGLASVPPAAHSELPTCIRSMAELWRSDLVPYRELLPRLPLVLLSSAAYKAYDFDDVRSAVLSTQIVDGLLRGKLGYRGMVVAPQLESQPVRGALDMSRAAVECLHSGCDMLLVEKEESWHIMRRGIEGAIASVESMRERLEQSLARIRATKKGWSPPQGQFPDKAWDRLARRFAEFSLVAWRDRE